MSEEQTLLDRWIAKGKNHPLIAVVCFAAIIFAGVASVASNIAVITNSEIYRKLFGLTDEVKVQPKEFKEIFKLKEDEMYVGDHYVSVRNGGINYDSDNSEWQILGIDIVSAGIKKSFVGIGKGALFKISRADCEWLEVLVKDVEEKVIKGTISGKCSK